MTAKKIKEKHSKDLKLDGEVPDFIKKLKISKGLEVPAGWTRSSQWDHLLTKLVTGDSVELSNKEAASFANRARNLNYLVVIRRVTKDKSRVWFEGLSQGPPRTRAKSTK